MQVRRGTDAQISPRSSLAAGCRQRTSQSVRGVQSLCSTERPEPRPGAPAQHPPDPCQEPPRVPIHPLSRSRLWLLPSSWDVEPVWSVLNSRLLSSRRFPFLHGFLSFFAAVELNSAAFVTSNCKQKRSTRRRTARGCPTLVRFFLPTPVITTRWPLPAPHSFVPPFLGLPLRALCWTTSPALLLPSPLFLTCSSPPQPSCLHPTVRIRRCGLGTSKQSQHPSKSSHSDHRAVLRPPGCLVLRTSAATA